MPELNFELEMALKTLDDPVYVGFGRTPVAKSSKSNATLN
jgi:hypothetical protein